MDFTAIDFETANKRPDSACQLAAVRVAAGRIVDQRCWLIRPRPFYFSRFNIQVHGIHPETVENEPDFGQLWSEIRDFLGSSCLIAHNAAFDMKVLLACLSAHDCPTSDWSFSCTRLIAKQTWPRWGRYGLKPISDRLEIRFRHHDALEDATACAKVLLAAAIRSQASSLEDLEQKLRIERGYVDEYGYRGAKKATRRPPRHPSHPVPQPRGGAFNVAREQIAEPVATHMTIDLHRLMLRAEMVRLWAGQSVLIRGPLQFLTIDQMTQLVRCAGGQCCTESQTNPDLVIVGPTESTRETDGISSPPHCAVLSEREVFERLVSDAVFD